MTPLYRHKYNAIAENYDKFERILDPFFLPLRQKAVSYAKGRTLEVGVGTGKNLPYYPKDVELYAIDGSEGMLKIAQKKAKKLGLDVKFFKMDAEKLSFPSEYFDTIIVSFVFCTVPNPVKAMSELRRVLKPNGKIIFLEHTLSNSKVPNLLFLRILKLFLYPILGDDTLRKTHNLVRDFFKIEREEEYYLGIVRFIVCKK